jgi:hypothetical protein
MSFGRHRSVPVMQAIPCTLSFRISFIDLYIGQFYIGQSTARSETPPLRPLAAEPYFVSASSSESPSLLAPSYRYGYRQIRNPPAASPRTLSSPSSLSVRHSARQAPFPYPKAPPSGGTRTAA